MGAAPRTRSRRWWGKSVAMPGLWLMIRRVFMGMFADTSSIKSATLALVFNR